MSLAKFFSSSYQFFPSSEKSQVTELSFCHLILFCCFRITRSNIF
ncbi:hypothetical protein SFK404_3500 [Shigella flexneri K-404]|nr:hypothetical protein SFK404_3500 [Shigella flexneri K-404]